MKPSEMFIFVFLLATFVSCQTTRKYGLYSGIGYSKGYNFYLNPDGTFEYKFRGHLYADTSAGTFKMTGDTIYFTYRYEPYKTEELLPPRPERPASVIWTKTAMYFSYSQGFMSDKRQVLKLMK